MILREVSRMKKSGKKGYLVKFTRVVTIVVTVGFIAGCQSVAVDNAAAKQSETVVALDQIITPPPDRSFLQNCIFVCVDFAEHGPKPKPMKQQDVPEQWAQWGLTAADKNAAVDFHYDSAIPNTRRTADACRALGMPMIFIHWGFQFKDGMDLAPKVRAEFTKKHGPDPGKWPNHISSPAARPAKVFNVRQGEYVLDKTDTDAFTSCNIEFVLRNLGIKNIVFTGGYTEYCLGHTASSAKRLEFKIMCIEDATTDNFESRRLLGIKQVGYDYIMTTKQFVEWTQANRNKP